MLNGTSVPKQCFRGGFFIMSVFAKKINIT